MTFTVNKQSEVMRRGSYFLALFIMFFSLAGCDADDGGTTVNTVALPLDTRLDLYCPNVGIANETCVLDDPNNPYARSIVNDSTKFDLAADTPSAKSRFYLWATAQARSPRGENQYYTALALHELYTQGASDLVRDQAREAYRSVLDNYFGSVTFFSFNPPEGELSIPQQLRDLVGENMYNPGNQNLILLYDNQARVLEAFGVWGYTYDPDTGIISRNI